jgi:hypothetical protein
MQQNVSATISRGPAIGSGPSAADSKCKVEPRTAQTRAGCEPLTPHPRSGPSGRSLPINSLRTARFRRDRVHQGGQVHPDPDGKSA